MDIFHYNPEQFLSFILTFMRISIIVFLLPFFGGTSLPNPVKAALCLVMSLAVWPKLSFSGAYMPASVWELVLMFMGELMIGLMLNIIVLFLFSAVQTGGQLVGFSMGFTMMNVVDPLSGTSEAITSHFLYQTTVLVFLSLDGHLYLLSGLAESFALVAPGKLLINPELAREMLKFSGQIFVLGVKIASPVIASLFLVDLALAIISRAAPQMNVLFVGFPIKITVGFLFLVLILTALSTEVGDYIAKLAPMYHSVLKASG